MRRDDFLLLGVEVANEATGGDGMDAAARRELEFDVEMALRRVPAGTWRDLGRRRLPGDDLPEKIAAGLIVEHLIRSRWRIERVPGGGADFGGVLRGPGSG